MEPRHETIMEQATDPVLQAAPARWRTGIQGVCLGLILIGGLLQWTIRDTFPFPVAAVYYALPRPVLCGLAILAAMVRSNRRAGWWGLVCIMAVWVGWCDVGWHCPATLSPTAETVVFWNIGNNLVDDVSVIDGFLESSPRVIGLVETGPLTPKWKAEWQSQRPGYQLVSPHPRCLLVVQGTVQDKGYVALGNGCHAGWADVAWKETTGAETTVRAVVVDFAANPWVSRKEPLQRLVASLQGWRGRPLVVMGDFNTPDDSVWYAGMKQDFREVFTDAGAGYAPTWPLPAPVLKLDQMWVNQAFRVQQAWRSTTWRSDHRAVWAELELDGRESP